MSSRTTSQDAKRVQVTFLRVMAQYWTRASRWSSTPSTTPVFFFKKKSRIVSVCPSPFANRTRRSWNTKCKGGEPEPGQRERKRHQCLWRCFTPRGLPRYFPPWSAHQSPPTMQQGLHLTRYLIFCAPWDFNPSKGLPTKILTQQFNNPPQPVLDMQCCLPPTRKKGTDIHTGTSGEITYIILTG